MRTPTLPSPTQRAALARMGAENHPWVELTRQLASRSGVYDDIGQHSLTMAFAEPDKATEWKADAVRKFVPWLLSNVIDQDSFNINTSREWGWYIPLAYGHLREAMTPQEQQDCEAQIKKLAEFVLGFHRWGPVTRLEDSDSVIGHLVLVRLTDLVLGTDYCSLTLASADDGALWVDCTYADMRQALRNIIAQAQGGELPESSSYNLGTSQLLILGCAAIGWDEFPEAKAWLVELGEQLRWQVTPDLKESVQWGDVENPHDLLLRVRVPLMLEVIGLGGDPEGKLLQLAAALPPVPGNYFWNCMYRAMWCFDPALLPKVPRVEHPVGLRHCANGLTIYRTHDTLLQVFAAHPTGYDHQMSQWDTRLWHHGDWLSDHPIGYSPWATNFNAALAFGLEPMSDRGRVSARLTADGCEIVLETRGPRYVGGWDRPPSYIDLWRQTIQLQPGKLTITNTVELRQPTRLERYEGWERAALETSPALTVIQHAPPRSEPETALGTPPGFTWLSRGGTRLFLRSNATATSRELVVIGTNIGTYISLGEDGGQLLRLTVNPPADEQGVIRAEIAAELTWGEPTPEPPAVVQVHGEIRIRPDGRRELVVPLP